MNIAKRLFVRATPALFGLLVSLNATADETYVELSAGPRADSLKWNYAIDLAGIATPNILSELTWRGLDIFQVSATAGITLENNLHLRGTFSYGWIYDGHNQDSDYLGDSRTLENRRSNNATSDDAVWDTTIGLGVRVPIAAGYIMPLVGYSQHAQNLRLTNGTETNPPTGPFPGLDSTYRTRWKGLWAGVEWFAEGRQNIDGFVRFEYHRSDYSAEANWNLRSDFQHPKSFEHDANGRGVILSLGLSTPLFSVWSGKVVVDIQNWSTYPGINRQFLANGTVAASRLNVVQWESRSLMFTLIRHL